MQRLFIFVAHCHKIIDVAQFWVQWQMGAATAPAQSNQGQFQFM